MRLDHRLPGQWQVDQNELNRQSLGHFQNNLLNIFTYMYFVIHCYNDIILNGDVNNVRVQVNTNYLFDSISGGVLFVTC